MIKNQKGKEDNKREKEKISNNLITKSNENHDNKVNEKDISKEKLNEIDKLEETLKMKIK